MTNNDIAVGRHHPNLDDRQAAERRLSRLFASFGIDAMIARERLIDPFIMRASQFWRSHHGIDFTALVVDEAELELKAWFSGVFGIENQDEQTSLMTGRAAFLMCNHAKQVSDLFLCPVDQLPGDFIQTMRDHAPQAVPPNIDGDMHHQPYEAWSIRQVMAKAVPIERGMMQLFGDWIRRDGRSLAFNWRNSGPTS